MAGRSKKQAGRKNRIDTDEVQEREHAVGGDRSVEDASFIEMLKNEMQIIVTLPHKEFMERLQNFFQETLTTVDEKARNYNGAQDDAFFTARVIEHFGVCDAKTSIVARIIEKVARLASLYKKGNGTKDESLYDTLEDICGHVGRLAILISLEEEIDGEAVEDEGEIRGTGSRQVVQGIWLEGGE